MNYLEATELIRLNTEIEHDLTLDGDLVPLPGKDPLVLLANRHRQGYVFYYRQQVPPGLRVQIDALGAERAFDDDAAVQAILAGFAPSTRCVEWVGGYFVAVPTPDQFPIVTLDGGSYLIEVDGMPVSRARTEHESDLAAEVIVEVLPEYRRQGYARQVAAAWAADVMQAGRVAFYSHLVNNLASAALGRSLGVVHYANWVAYLRCRDRHASRTRLVERISQN